MAEQQGDGSSQPQLNDQLTYWRNLKQGATDGTFSMDLDLAADLWHHTDGFRAELEDKLLSRARTLGILYGYGNLPSSLALKSAFEQKADSSPDSLVSQYKKAIDIVTTMRDTYDQVIQKITGEDAASAMALGKIHPSGA